MNSEHFFFSPPAGYVEGQPRFVEVNGLRHHLLEWKPDGSDEPEVKGVVLLAHGFLDSAYSFVPLATHLVNAGYHVIAWDFRGHGRTQRIGAGGYYHFADYMRDVNTLMDELELESVHLIGHSMGGNVALQLTAVRPERVETLTLVEGLGPNVQPMGKTPERMKRWLETLQKWEPKRVTSEAPLAGIRGALERMRRQHPTLGDELGLFLAERLSRSVQTSDSSENPDSPRTWRFDPLHRTTSPTPFSQEILDGFLAALAVADTPKLIISGENGYRPDEKARLSALGQHTFVEIPAVGHMVHWFEPKTLANAWLQFVHRVESGD